MSIPFDPKTEQQRYGFDFTDRVSLQSEFLPLDGIHPHPDEELLHPLNNLTSKIHEDFRSMLRFETRVAEILLLPLLTPEFIERMLGSESPVALEKLDPYQVLVLINNILAHYTYYDWRTLQEISPFDDNSRYTESFHSGLTKLFKNRKVLDMKGLDFIKATGVNRHVVERIGIAIRDDTLPQRHHIDEHDYNNGVNLICVSNTLAFCAIYESIRAYCQEYDERFKSVRVVIMGDDNHLWPEVLLLDCEGNVHGIPIEVTGTDINLLEIIDSPNHLIHRFKNYEKRLQHKLLYNTIAHQAGILTYPYIGLTEIVQCAWEVIDNLEEYDVTSELPYSAISDLAELIYWRLNIATTANNYNSTALRTLIKQIVKERYETFDTNLTDKLENGKLPDDFIAFEIMLSLLSMVNRKDYHTFPSTRFINALLANGEFVSRISHEDKQTICQLLSILLAKQGSELTRCRKWFGSTKFPRDESFTNLDGENRQPHKNASYRGTLKTVLRDTNSIFAIVALYIACFGYVENMNPVIPPEVQRAYLLDSSLELIETLLNFPLFSASTTKSLRGKIEDPIVIERIEFEEILNVLNRFECFQGINEEQMQKIKKLQRELGIIVGNLNIKHSVRNR